MKLSPIYFIIFLLIIVCLIVSLGNKHIGIWFQILIIAIPILGLLIYSRKKEKLEEPVEITTSTNVSLGGQNQLNFDTDDRSYSEYRNISTTADIDPLLQRRADLIIPSDNTIDNSDIVQNVLMMGSSTFLPNNAQGISTTSSAYHSNFTLGEPDPHIKNLAYTVPLNDPGLNLDQALARKQQHRGSMNKRSIDGNVRNTKNVFQRNFINELDENEEREWWSAEAFSLDVIPS